MHLLQSHQIADNYKKYTQAIQQALSHFDQITQPPIITLNFDTSQAYIIDIEISGNADRLPLRTQNYVPLLQSIRLQNPTPIILQKLTPLSLTNSSLEEDHLSFIKKVVLSARKEAQYYLPNCLKPFLHLYCPKLKDLFCQSRNNLDKQIDQIQSHYIAQIPKQPYIFPIKQQLKRFNRYFCPICNLYMCSLHFWSKNQRNSIEKEPSNSVYDVLQDDPYFDEDYESTYKPNKPMEKFDICYECADGCGLQIHQLKKFQRKGIEHLIEYGFDNACFITKVLQNQRYPLTCGSVQNYLTIYKQKSQFTGMKNKKKAKRNLNSQNNVYQIYTPCFHEGECGQGSCECYICHKWCGCQGKCAQSRKGCNCQNCGFDERKQKNNCPCYNQSMECDPNICGCQSCRNQNMSNEKTLALVLGRSMICNGLGLFAGEEIGAHHYVGEYTGNYLLLDSESQGIEICDQLIQSHYLFEVDEQWQVDGTFYGNKTRFINHASRKTGLNNCQAQVLFAEGRWRIGIYSMKKIQIGEELYFDYGDKFKTDWLLHFNKLVDKMLK